MTTTPPPAARPATPYFSSGPCAKRPGWSLDALSRAAVARSHRSKPARDKLAEVIQRSRALLGIPPEYRVAIVPASDTGAMEMALWSLLGPRGVDVLAWESFGQGWANDVVRELRIADTRVLDAPYGELPDLGAVDWSRDVVFAWNGTTSGVRIPRPADGGFAWIDGARDGLAICDATSAVFAMELPWERLDVVTWSWQKALGGEAQHGMLALGPRAVARLESHRPAWPIPKIFRLTKAGALIDGLFAGDTINTPSMLCVEDHLDALAWADSIGGLPALIRRAEANLARIEAWVGRSDWAAFLAARADIRSNTSVCLTIAGPQPAAAARDIAARLDAEGVAFDIGAYRAAPPGLRIWAGGTIEEEDIARLLPWLDWAYHTARA